MLSAKQEPTKSISSRGSMRNPGSGTATIVLKSIIFAFLKSTATDLQAYLREGHVHETGTGVGTMLGKEGLDTRGGIGVLGHHVKIAAAPCPREFIAQTEVVDQRRQGSHRRRIGTGIELLVLHPRAADKVSHLPEMAALDGFIHLYG